MLNVDNVYTNKSTDRKQTLVEEGVLNNRYFDTTSYAQYKALNI